MKTKRQECVVRAATNLDIGQIANLYTSSFPEHVMVHRNLLNNHDYLIERIKCADERWVVEENNGVIRGVAALAMAPPIGLGEIERVCVDREHRGRGIALSLCAQLIEDARLANLGFVEAFARGDQPGMQRTFDKLGFRVYGVAPRFEVVHNGVIVREQFVHMGLELKPETIDESKMSLIPSARKVYDIIQ